MRYQVIKQSKNYYWVFDTEKGYISKRIVPDLTDEIAKAVKKVNKKPSFTFSLTGRSIAQLIEAGCPVWSAWHEESNFEKKTTKPRKINLVKGVSLKDSLGKTFNEQKKLIEEYNGVVLSANELVELLWLYYKKTGKWYIGYWLTSDTLSDGGNGVYVNTHPVHGISVGRWYDDEENEIEY